MADTDRRHQFLLRFLICAAVFPFLAGSVDLINTTQHLTKDQLLGAPGGKFELGFFDAGDSGNWYLGIWYKNVEVQNVVWVANRDAPLGNSSGVLKISSDGGGLVLENEEGLRVWSANRTSGGNLVAELLDTGNFVLREEDDEDPENYVWQSFDYPTDTLLPGMKLGWDAKSGLNRYLHSWKSPVDPSYGDYIFKMNTSGSPEIYLTKKQKVEYRSGPWTGIGFSGGPEMKPNEFVSFLFKMNSEEVYYHFELYDKSVLSRLMVSHAGGLQRLTWIPTSKHWNSHTYAKDQCDHYGECGEFGICDPNTSPVCNCMVGFQPKNQNEWNFRDGSAGCVRVSELDCGKDGFLNLSNVKLPESRTAFVDPTMTLDQCKDSCRRNCACKGYSSYNTSNGVSGCVTWEENLFDVRQYAPGSGGQSFFLRAAESDLVTGVTSGSGKGDGGSNATGMIVGITVGTTILIIGLVAFFTWKRKTKTKSSKVKAVTPKVPRSQDLLIHAHQPDEVASDEADLLLNDFNTIAIATQNFSTENKLGQGGFGSVYKGVLADGQVIAVKRLAKSSGQGISEFKNEVRLIARLQHRNLVRLLGYCFEKEEKLLIYEYMENKSLDSILFNKSKSSVLDWPRRFHIINSVGRGLLYLHQDSRFRIIHRDLKTSNILLDKDMNPKISDFGTARIFGGDQTQDITRKVVGTYGYMSPEYAMDGLFSIKSDVFSFGIIILEIVSGMKNRGFYESNNQLNLLAQAWELNRDGRSLELMDSEIGSSYTASEVIRCIQVGLLCAQAEAEDRPNMSSVLMMLGSESASIPQPKNPGYCLRRLAATNDSSSGKQDESRTQNEVTLTIIEGR